MNNCTFMGVLTRNPILEETQNGSHVVTFTIVTSRFYKRSDGESATETTYLEMEAWDSGAKKIARDFRKNDKILVEASVKNLGNDTVFRVNKFYSV